jgi:hypothetical protein
MKRTTSLTILAALAAFAILGTSAFGESSFGNFPKAGEYVLHSTPGFLVTVGDNTEHLKCDAQLTLRTGEPYVTADGTRRVDLQIIDWKAVGNSELFGGEVTFRMRKGIGTEDLSYVQSLGVDSNDFPAHAQFAMPYELETPFGTVDGLYGVTRGTIEAFPPQPGAQFKMWKGDVANVMAELLPEPLSALSAAGDTEPIVATVEPEVCVEDSN